MQTLRCNRHFLKEQLEAKLPNANYRIPDCSYLAWIDVSEYNLGEHPPVVLELGKVSSYPRVISLEQIASNLSGLTSPPVKRLSLKVLIAWRCSQQSPA